MATNLLSIKQRFGIIGRSVPLDHALNTAVRVAPTDLTVLISGESGVGKEVFSKIIHSLSPRKHNNFIAVNCGAIPEGTINSELFGHEKGAFTGATSTRKGYFETVDGGTIFLDEIGEMPLETQTFLLRVLEQGEFIKVGGDSVQKTDVRVVAATNADLLDKVKRGKFREDLYYRLSTVPIDVPALRERPEDIYLLFRKFSSDIAEKYRSTPIVLDDSAQRILIDYAWPGNIRELKNVAEQMSVLSTERNISAIDIEKYLPNLRKRNLPILASSVEKETESFREREILYKLLFDMKSDLNDLKTLVFELISNNDLRVPEGNQLKQLNKYRSIPEELGYTGDKEFTAQPFETPRKSQPIIIESNGNTNDGYRNVEEVEESLSIEDMEKELITKALRKHRSRRKDAASELGISERTLYRKIKHYHIQE